MQSLQLSIFVMLVSALFKQLSFCKLHIFPLVLMKWLLTCNDSSLILMAPQDVLMTLCKLSPRAYSTIYLLSITDCSHYCHHWKSASSSVFYETVWAFIRLSWLPLSPSFEGEFTVVIRIYKATVVVPDRDKPFFLRVRMWCSSISLAGISCVFIINVVVIC